MCVVGHWKVGVWGAAFVNDFDGSLSWSCLGIVFDLKGPKFVLPNFKCFAVHHFNVKNCFVGDFKVILEPFTNFSVIASGVRRALVLLQHEKSIGGSHKFKVLNFFCAQSLSSSTIMKAKKAFFWTLSDIFYGLKNFVRNYFTFVLTRKNF